MSVVAGSPDPQPPTTATLKQPIYTTPKVKGVKDLEFVGRASKTANSNNLLKSQIPVESTSTRRAGGILVAPCQNQLGSISQPEGVILFSFNFYEFLSPKRSGLLVGRPTKTTSNPNPKSNQKQRAIYKTN